MGDITDTLDIAVITLARQAFGDEPFDAVGPLDVNETARRIRAAQEEAERLRRLRQCVYHGVQVAEFNQADLIIARLGRSRRNHQNASKG